MSLPTSRELSAWLRPFGARAPDIVDLDALDPDHAIRYLDLVRPPRARGSEPWPRAVVEVDDQPVLYVVCPPLGREYDAAEIAWLRRMLAFRVDAEYVALLAPGRLTVYPVEPTRRPPAPEPVSADALHASTLIPALAFPGLEEYRERGVHTAQAVHELLYGLLTRTTRSLAASGVAPLDALSLVGRALFVRFLVDRNVLGAEDIHAIAGSSIEDAFSSPRRAARMSRWLDQTFNGDFLPLTRTGAQAWFRELDDRVFAELSNVLHRATAEGQLHLHWGDGWHDLRFDHIPVGLLSQVYEEHAHRYDTEQARVTSVHYTPRHVAEYMVDEAFLAMGERAARARVLDPAVGGGVFLVAAFRRLAAEHWRARGRRPTTRTLRRILYEQLTGFDISEPALRLCSLGLYLTAIELDHQPRPVARLRFDAPLLGTVLHNVAAPEKEYAYIGSLSRRTVGPAHDGRYDLVIGNPPWTQWKKSERVSEDALDAQVAEVTAAVQTVVRERLGEAAASRQTMLGKLPDLPFLWRAMQWARPDGHIALALHGRLLFRQTPKGVLARTDAMRALRITGILNGTDLRDTRFWPDVRAPFCLLFARNALPDENAVFHYLSPELEKGLNQYGRIRIDSSSARPVSLAEARARPALMKTLYRGTALDSQLMARIESSRLESLGGYWESNGWKDHKGVGFKVGGAADAKKAAPELWGLPELSSGLQPSHSLDPARLPGIARGTRLARPRKRTIYQAPLVIVPESPPVDRAGVAAYLALGDIAYSKSFIGFSCARHRDGALLARYLFLLFNSRLPLYWTLMTSSRFGIERDVFLVEDLERIPFVPLEELPRSVRDDIEPLANALMPDRGPDRDQALVDVERWVAREIYGLGDTDREVIQDTLAISLPFAENRIRAQSRPGADEIHGYVERLRDVLDASLLRYRKRAHVAVLDDGRSSPWVLMRLDIRASNARPPRARAIPSMAELLEQAESLSASHIVVPCPPSSMVIATVAQNRYLTRSRARLTALELIHEHASLLLGEAA